MDPPGRKIEAPSSLGEVSELTVLYGIVVVWSYGLMVLWSYGLMVLWS